EDQHAEAGALEEPAGDRDAIEERVGQQSHECPDTDAARHHRVRVCLDTEMEVRCERVLRQMHDEVSGQYGNETTAYLDRVREHAEDHDREHESGTEAGE